VSQGKRVRGEKRVLLVQPVLPDQKGLLVQMGLPVEMGLQAQQGLPVQQLHQTLRSYEKDRGGLSPWIMLSATTFVPGV
jgi:hypothetical protein